MNPLTYLANWLLPASAHRAGTSLKAGRGMAGTGASPRTGRERGRGQPISGSALLLTWP